MSVPRSGGARACGRHDHRSRRRELRARWVCRDAESRARARRAAWRCRAIGDQQGVETRKRPSREPAARSKWRAVAGGELGSHRPQSRASGALPAIHGGQSETAAAVSGSRCPQRESKSILRLRHSHCFHSRWGQREPRAFRGLNPRRFFATLGGVFGLPGGWSPQNLGFQYLPKTCP